MISIVAVFLGISLGFLSSKMLFLQWFTLIPWCIAAVIIGYFSKNKKASLINGAIYGFLLGFIFMMGQYTGSDPLTTKLFPFAVLGLVSAIFAMLLSFVGYLVKVKIKKNS